MKNKIRNIVAEFTREGVDFDISISPRPELGHYSTSLALKLAKREDENPLEFAKKLALDIKSSAPVGLFDRVEAVAPGFINFWLTEKFIRESLKFIVKEGENYGRSKIGKGKRVIVEYSSPNIAKPMHVGHLRSTIIGDALANIFEFTGHKVTRWNYISDWGTQFGKLVAAYKLWGDDEKIKNNPIDALLDLYIKFSREEKKDPSLADKGREEFWKLEKDDKENRRLWSWFKKESLIEFNKIYNRLGVSFDETIGESNFQKDLSRIIDLLKEKKVAEPSEGSLIVRLDKFNLPTALVQKSDGASLYITRELANLQFRLKKYKSDKILYVVGNEQSLYFNQFFAIANLLGWNKAELIHVKFGLTLGEDRKKFATREGKLIPLEEVINRSVELARRVVEVKNPNLREEKKQNIAEVIGIGALKYYDLKENRMSGIIFDWDQMLDLRGNSAPYIQYTYARLMGIKSKIGRPGRADFNLLTEKVELGLIKMLIDFPDTVSEVTRNLITSNLAGYLYGLASEANRFYELVPVIKDNNPDRRSARVALVGAIAQTLKTGLGLLGIEVLEEI